MCMFAPLDVIRYLSTFKLGRTHQGQAIKTHETTQTLPFSNNLFFTIDVSTIMRWCTYCGKPFTRDEHLERHILTHSEIKPYKCCYCHMSFARRDLLQRHYTVHGKDHNNQEVLPPNNGMIVKSAGRTPKACTNCAKTKTKCDNKFPCSRCKSRNQVCEMRPNRRASKQTAVQVETHQKEISTCGKAATEGLSPQDRSSSSSPTRCENQEQQDTSKKTLAHEKLSVRDSQRALSGQTMFGDHAPATSSHEIMVSELLSPAPEPNDFGNENRYDGSLLQAGSSGSNPDRSNSSAFFMDWSQLQMNGAYTSELMNPGDMDFGINFLNTETTDEMLDVNPHFSHAIPTPLHTPRMEHSFASDIDMSCSTNTAHSVFFASRPIPSPRQPSVCDSYDSGVSGFTPVGPAQDLEWTMCRYTPPLPSHAVPKTLQASLNRLSASLQNHEVWSNWQPAWDEEGAASDDRIVIVPLHESTRDKLLAITQAFLHKAFETHRNGFSGPIAEMSSMPILRAALIFIIQAAWSGDKWQTDVAMSRRGMYLAMLGHSGMLSEAPTQSQALSHNLQSTVLEESWKDWVKQEGRSRLIYSWVMVDQDLALFHNSAPLLNVSDFEIPMPDSDQLWHAKSAQEWSTIMLERSKGAHTHTRPSSLRTLLGRFLDNDLVAQSLALTPLQLRLLLHPLQSSVCSYTQLSMCCSDPLHLDVPATTSTLDQFKEVQTLLQRWYKLAKSYLDRNRLCTIMQVNLIMFHLISLNAVTNFAEIEKLARREGFDGTYQQVLWLHKRCITNVEEAIFHAGQVLRLVRNMARSIRPPWWSGAIYRVALILWTDALRHNDSTSSPSFNDNNDLQGNLGASNGSLSRQPERLRSNNRLSTNKPSIDIAVDALPADHPLIIQYTTKKEGTPVLTSTDGSPVAMNNAFVVLSHCIDVLDQGIPTLFSDGIRIKLERLTRD
ncbi:hypothetical protein EJ05DRAFT_379744 [Pseudovirgaria hyperparasitica]|uniref:Transcription factor Cmr1 n=1 Tax=Pseudovirgaria hyperparasitica TaxID=470096 RepID=A0A6A6WAM8_9PEZI|nr:uncharacterized protein EJ05DRAFT_379744 [Pseudovirgaria hyperparasitica]KAF2758171.1 hypothetical protein EJ05DRAFT_379744 [Pseudovirgaria hyperparasitica]